MHINPFYNFLLARPWIHSAGAVPLSLHQKLKLVMEGRPVIINAEMDIIASVTSDAPYIGADDEAIKCSFRSLEFVNATFIVEERYKPDTRQKKKGVEEEARKEKSATEWEKGQVGTNDLSPYIQNVRVRRNHLS
ncbi:aldehyde dehydrogenase family 2 member C4-like [Gossypium australe]|uniref:Aldehyde dehydrogenase family 2 member C4-like n=1 Tax=Gossypium australe TaxID=47621 RepID=A0A5B6X426_9ROSI|nr:aldehyde dehydrogenase family 2 member C4-like [Gossypium australe]